jgi:hypothetical protein
LQGFATLGAVGTIANDKHLNKRRKVGDSGDQNAKCVVTAFINLVQATLAS